MGKIAAVIVTYNRKDLLIEALQSVLSQTALPEYVFVIDNASTDGTREAVMSKFDFDNQKLIYCQRPENLGGSAGFSYGIQQALKTDCDWISISDDDAIFQPGYFSALRTAITEHATQQVFSGSVLLPNGKHDEMHREVLVNSETLTVKPIAEADYATDFYYDVFSFVGILLSRKLVTSIGLPEQDYFIRFDDFEYAIRALKDGRFLNIHGAKVLHKTTYTRSAIAPWKEYYVMRNRIAVLFKHRGESKTTRRYCRRFLARKLVAILLFKNRWGQARALGQAYLAGYRDGRDEHLGRNPQFLP